MSDAAIAVNQDAAKPTELAKATEQSKATEPQQVIYCGPTLPAQHGLKQFTVFNNGLPEHVKELLGKCQALGNLIVPVENLAAVRVALTKPGSVENVMYQEIKKAF